MRFVDATPSAFVVTLVAESDPSSEASEKVTTVVCCVHRLSKASYTVTESGMEAPAAPVFVYVFAAIFAGAADSPVAWNVSSSAAPIAFATTVFSPSLAAVVVGSSAFGPSVHAVVAIPCAFVKSAPSGSSGLLTPAWYTDPFAISNLSKHMFG